MSKLSAGLITLVFGDFTPCYEVKNTVRMFRDDVAARGVQLLYEQDPSIDALGVDFVRGDSGRFVQVIVNLISNAIKFTENVPRRVVRVRIGATLVQEDNMGVDGDAWPEMDQEELLPMCDPCMPRSRPARLRLYVAVADSGVGMNLEDQTRLFQRFAQANPRTYGEFGGSGLGLVGVPSYLKCLCAHSHAQYVSRMLVELHGGKIHMQSTKGVGTIVRFFLTVDRSTVVPTPPSTPVETSSELIFPVLQVPDDRRLRVLVVEVRHASSGAHSITNETRPGQSDQPTDPRQALEVSSVRHSYMQGWPGVRRPHRVPREGRNCSRVRFRPHPHGSRNVRLTGTAFFSMIHA
jgi:hypothetical protein